MISVLQSRSRRTTGRSVGGRWSCWCHHSPSGFAVHAMPVAGVHISSSRAEGMYACTCLMWLWRASCVCSCALCFERFGVRKWPLGFYRLVMICLVLLWFGAATHTKSLSAMRPVSCPVPCSEETRCRFCDNVLPDWRPALTPTTLKPVASVMSVRYRGVTHRITYTPGPDGLQHFLETLQSIGIKVASASQVTFLCRAPDTGGAVGRCEWLLGGLLLRESTTV